ncbi:MAG: histidine kinase [Flavobacterium sp. JAD_PAG50586_2]|nr:MAG: histidine kinase [Flavobacterium sp. JAD_PAG50586_2]
MNHKHINIEDQVPYTKELALIYKQLNDYPKALEYFEKYMVLNDSLNQISYKNEIADLEAEFKNKENTIKINQLKIQKNSAELKAQNNRLKYSIFGITTMVLLILILFILLYQRKKNQLIKEKYLKNKQEIRILKNQKELEVIQAMMDGEELERKRIARELHDGIGSKLSALKIKLSHLKPSDTSYNGNLENINQLLGTSINELQQISYNLVPESLLKLGLENAVSDLCHLLHSESVKIEFQSFGITQDIPIPNQINIYRIVQELINNALKHAECSEILVSCSQNENTFYIAVEDNGIGYDIEKVKVKPGQGLKNLKNRIEMLNGIFNIESSSGGTFYNIELTLDL